MNHRDFLPLPALTFKRLGYHFSDDGTPNLYGVRGRSPFMDLASLPPEFASQTNKWDDIIGVFWKEDGYWHDLKYKGTTDPGDNHPEYDNRQRGVAVMKPGQYIEAYQLGDHRGHPALVNWGRCAPNYWRIVKVDARPVVKAEGSEYIGLNIHRARKHGETPDSVGPFSKGCQVVQDNEDFEALLATVEKCLSTGGRSTIMYLDYTLLTEDQVFKLAEIPQGGQA